MSVLFFKPAPASDQYVLCRLVPQLQKYDCGIEFWKSFVRTVQSRTTTLIAHGWTPIDISGFLKALVETALSQTRFEAAPPLAPEPSYSRFRLYPGQKAPKSPAVLTDTCDLLSLCIETKNIPSAAILFQELLVIMTNVQAIKYTLEPLLPAVCTVLKDHHLTSDMPPFDSFFREAMKHYVLYLLGPKPHLTSPVWRGGQSSCTCTDCAHVNKLLAVADSEFTWRANQKSRKHVEGMLRGQAGLTFETIKTGSPQGLRVVKSRVFTEVAGWRQKSASGIALLKAIANDETLGNIWAREDGGLKKILVALGGEVGPLRQPFTADRQGGALPNPKPAPQHSSSSLSTDPANAPALLSPRPIQSAVAGDGHAPPATIPQKRRMDCGRAVDVDLTHDSD